MKDNTIKSAIIANLLTAAASDIRRSRNTLKSAAATLERACVKIDYTLLDMALEARDEVAAMIENLDKI